MEKLQQLQLGELTITWLHGGCTYLDGGAMFGVVPKPLWSKKYACNENNQIKLRTDPMLVQKDGLNLLIESGLGNGKLTEKQQRNLGVQEESYIDESLASLGLTKEDIDYVLMTHLHYDHACGLTMWERDRLVPSFPNAKHIVSQIEWDEMRQPNIRSRHAYWSENWQPIVDLVHPFDQKTQIMDEISMIHTGGHSAGHAIIYFQSEGMQALHLADIMPTHAHQNPLWVMAYDDYPMDSIFAKEKWMKKLQEEECWALFYHDAKYRAMKWNKDGHSIDALEFV